MSTLATLHDYAVSYAKMGFKVFPARLSGGKKLPLTQHGHKDASSDPAVVHSLFSEFTGAEANIIGMVHEGFLVFDVDVKGGKKGLESFESIRHKLPEPLAVQKTSGGGWHYFYPIPPGYEPKRRTDFLPGLDLLSGPKGWVAVAPSVGYEFIVGDMEAVRVGLA